MEGKKHSSKKPVEGSPRTVSEMYTEKAANLLSAGSRGEQLNANSFEPDQNVVIFAKEDESDNKIVTVRTQAKMKTARRYSTIPVICGRCNEVFSHADAILKKYIIEEIITDNAGPSCKTDFVCGLCKIRIDKREDLKNHLLNHIDLLEFLCDQCSLKLKAKRGPTPKSPPATDYDAACERPFKCGRCKREKGDTLVLKLTRRHSTSKVKPSTFNYFCSTCGTYTTTREEMCDHLTHHILAGEILCKECSEHDGR